MAEGVSTWFTKTLKFASSSRAASLTTSAVGGVVVSKPMAKKTTSRSGSSWAMRSASAAEYTMRMSAPWAFAFRSDRPLEAGHAHGVGVGAEGDVLTPASLLPRVGGGWAFQRQLDRHVDAPDGQHAHRAAGPVHHHHVGRQQVLHAVARDGVGVAAAELHEVVGAAGVRRLRDARGDGARELPVAELVHVLHAASCDAASPAKSSRVFRASSGSSFCSA